MIPFQKLFALVIRTFSRPMINYLQLSHRHGQPSSLRWVFVGAGRHYHRFEHWLNHQVLKTYHKAQLTELKEEVLLEKGVSALYELLFYSIVIGIPLFELYKGAVSAHLKEQQLLQNIGVLEDQLQALNKTLETALAMAKSKNNDALQVVDQRQTALQQLYKTRQSSKSKATKCQAEQRQQEAAGQSLSDRPIQIQQRQQKSMGQSLQQSLKDRSRKSAQNQISPQRTYKEEEMEERGGMGEAEAAVGPVG